MRRNGFFASPYPIIISAEIHCSIGHQDLIAAIMMQVFGEKLAKMSMDGEGSEKEAASSDDADERSTGISRFSTPHGAYYRGCTSRSLPHANDESSGSILGERTTHGRNTTTIPLFFFARYIYECLSACFF
jgi:hypothetical protein